VNSASYRTQLKKKIYNTLASPSFLPRHTFEFFLCRDSFSTPPHCRSCSVADEDIPSIDTPAAPTKEHIQGPITRARAKQLNYQVLLFLGTLSHIHENMVLPKSDMFVTLRNDGTSMDERDKHLSMIVHGHGSKRLRIEEDATSGDFRTLKPP
jgi:hypothetical protein